MTRRSSVGRAVALAAILVAAACRPAFQPRNYASSTLLYNASMAEYNKKRYDNAVTGFERLTLDLSARDTLLPLAHWWLAHAHGMKLENLLAASSYARLAESFPDDTLAPRAMLLAGASYRKLWRRPDLDATYGDLAQIQFRQLSALYPDSPERKLADSASQEIDENKAAKDYGTGMFYVRRNAFESSLIFFKDVVKNYPNTRMARNALMAMVNVYRRPQLKYLPEAAETCVTLRTAYAGDAEVAALCPKAVPADSVGVKPKPPVVPKPGVEIPSPAKKPPERSRLR